MIQKQQQKKKNHQNAIVEEQLPLGEKTKDWNIDEYNIL